VIKFVFNGVADFANWWILLEENGDRELCVHNPGKEVDVQIRSDLRTMTEIWAGDTQIRTASKDGRLQLSGNTHLDPGAAIMAAHRDFCPRAACGLIGGRAGRFRSRAWEPSLHVDVMRGLPRVM
jgi:hypothetical protein